MVAGALIAALVAVVGSFGIAQALRTSAAVTAIKIDATPIESFDNRDASRVRFGDLDFRGGLVLTSSYGAFGGISSIRMESDGEHFLAVTDNGSWLRGRIVYRDGKPAAIADAEMAPMLAWDGKPLAAHRWHDAESLTELDGQFYVGIERREKIVRFDYRRYGLAARGEPIKVPAEFDTFSNNQSLECLAAGPRDSALAGTLIVVTEHSLDAAGNHRAFLLKGSEVGSFTVKRSGGFDVSDCTVLPPSDLLLLERRFSPLTDLAMRIRRIPLNALKPGALADGPTIVQADLGYQIDNMEGIGLHRTAAGETVLTLVSDDNFSAFQRSLLLQFTLARE